MMTMAIGACISLPGFAGRHCDRDQRQSCGQSRHEKRYETLGCSTNDGASEVSDSLPFL